jgi:hypothetical protein
LSAAGPAPISATVPALTSKNTGKKRIAEISSLTRIYFYIDRETALQIEKISSTDETRLGTTRL